jgi:hypothetical protein
MAARCSSSRDASKRADADAPRLDVDLRDVRSDSRVRTLAQTTACVFDRVMRRLRSAIVLAAKGTTVHRVVTAAGEVVVPTPHHVTIVEDHGQVFVLREDADNACMADTWHESVDEAVAAVLWEYEIGPWDPAP